MGTLDLHVHTDASDGVCTPTEVVQAAADLGVGVIAITDHDTVAGLAEALDASAGSGVRVIPGVEISADHDGVQVHILGYFVDHTMRAFSDGLERFAATRLERAHAILARLDALGVRLPAETLAPGSDGGAVGRPHIARLMVQEGYVASIEEAFCRYLAQGQKAYVPRAKVSPASAIGMIHAARGVAVLAHPWSILFLLEELVPAGLDGIEVFYRDYDTCQHKRLSAVAREHALARTGGSDFHGPGRASLPIGGAHVPADCLAELEARCARRREC